MKATIIASIALVVIVGWAVWYIVKEKKRGTRCIGCPMAGNCSKANAGGNRKKHKPAA